MAELPVPASPPDPATRMAYENLFLAQERTLLSWVQVGLAFITFGFSIAKAFQFLQDTKPDKGPLLGGRTVGILIMAVGLVALGLASVQHQSAIRALRRQCPGLPISHASILAGLLAGLAIVALCGAFLRN